MKSFYEMLKIVEVGIVPTAGTVVGSTPPNTTTNTAAANNTNTAANNTTIPKPGQKTPNTAAPNTTIPQQPGQKPLNTQQQLSIIEKIKELFKGLKSLGVNL
jgi:transcription elongation factor